MTTKPVQVLYQLTILNHVLKRRFEGALIFQMRERDYQIVPATQIASYQ